MFDPRKIPLRSTCHRLLRGLWVCLLGSCSLAAVRGDELPSLEKALLQQSSTILKFAQQQGYKNLGVLKFRIREGNGKPSDRNGLLNRNLAERLELALILKNRPLTPVGIIHNASDVAAKISGASHLTAAGRQNLFSTTYPLAWGTTKVTPDAFLVGVVLVETDFKTVLVGISAFGRNDEKLRDVVKFSASLTTNELVEIGASFNTRSVFGGGAVKFSAGEREKKAADAAAQQTELIKSDRASHPLNEKSSPVTLTVQYDGSSVPIEFRDGGAYIREPSERQKVTLTLLRTNSADKGRYAIVLKVNGENTLYRQRLKDLDCSKWILGPNSGSIKIEGFQLDDQQRQQFQVLSQQASRAREMDYGADVGTISLVVFQEQGPATPAPEPVNILDEEAEDFAILSRGTFPKVQPESLEALKSQLAQSSTNRGLITEGQTVAGAVRKVTFEVDPVPIMAASITYYQP